MKSITVIQMTTKKTSTKKKALKVNLLISNQSTKKYVEKHMADFLEIYTELLDKTGGERKVPRIVKQKVGIFTSTPIPVDIQKIIHTLNEIPKHAEKITAHSNHYGSWIEYEVKELMPVTEESFQYHVLELLRAKVNKAKRKTRKDKEDLRKLEQLKKDHPEWFNNA
ncbi:hypothetical protein H6775_03815 [Candidatus Nomurabacteria bacterium]|nr:hypothetical protein [Candidatus Nomurabacteria bacterium]